MREWREIANRFGVDVSRDHPATELTRTSPTARRWFKVEGGKVFLADA